MDNNKNTKRKTKVKTQWYDLDFIMKRIKEVHGDKYDYSKMVIDPNQTYDQYVTIICPIHGPFSQRLRNHLLSHGCNSCIPRRKKLTLEDFIERATKIHNGIYGYDRVKSFKNNKDYVEIYCKEGSHYFKQRIDGHLQGRKCPICYKKVRYDTKKFIELAKQVHGDKYDYSKVNYVDIETPVTIICDKKHEFSQKPAVHLAGSGCYICTHHFPLTTEEFIERAKEIHGDRYDYSQVNYVNSNTMVTVICREHGPFNVLPFNHLRNVNCPKCAGGVVLTTEEFIERARKVHGNQYDYSKVNYVNTKTPVIVTCSIHGDYIIAPNAHLRHVGCPACGQSILESQIKNELENNNITYEAEKRFDWLGRMSLDFYLPDYNVAIECQGLQHFQEVDFFGGKEGFDNTIQRDEKKSNLCKENNVKLYYYTSNKYENLNWEKYKLYYDKKELITEIKNSK